MLSIGGEVRNFVSVTRTSAARTQAPVQRHDHLCESATKRIGLIWILHRMKEIRRRNG